MSFQAIISLLQTALLLLSQVESFPIEKRGEVYKVVAQTVVIAQSSLKEYKPLKSEEKKEDVMLGKENSFPSVLEVRQLGIVDSSITPTYLQFQIFRSGKLEYPKIDSVSLYVRGKIIQRQTGNFLILERGAAEEKYVVNFTSILWSLSDQDKDSVSFAVEFENERVEIPVKIKEEGEAVIRDYNI